MKRTSVLVIAALAAACLVVVLAVQNRGLRAERAALEARIRQPYPGMFVPQLTAAGIDGAPVGIATADTDLQVLYFFLPGCPHCAASATKINALAARLARDTGGQVPLIGVGNGSAAELLPYARDQRFAFPIAALADQRTLALFRASAVPLVLVVDRNGRVHHSALGAFDSDAKLEAVLAAVRAGRGAKVPTS
jgi:peroxiredoxin